jgi:hypothetical protein
MVKIILTAEEITAIAEKKTEHTDSYQAIRRQINKLFRSQDNSKLFPVNGRFNVTERAIQRARGYESQSGIAMEPLEYALFIEDTQSKIVNDNKLL